MPIQSPHFGRPGLYRLAARTPSPSAGLVARGRAASAPQRGRAAASPMQARTPLPVAPPPLSPATPAAPSASAAQSAPSMQPLPARGERRAITPVGRPGRVAAPATAASNADAFHAGRG
ncbi:hypothetical protein [Derxia lacustris]|uniref:hypothetical protein n=1 Tax=Derxia lacustris TaxID=764842 RepID=UPI000A16E588|nr:hypothetical protein [Derxia lacustris]